MNRPLCPAPLDWKEDQEGNRKVWILKRLSQNLELTLARARFTTPARRQGGSPRRCRFSDAKMEAMEWKSFSRAIMMK